MVEQLTLNQPVQGSSPWGLTTYYYSLRLRLEEGTASKQEIVFAGEVSELADEHDLGSCAARRRSSSLLFPTTPKTWRIVPKDRIGDADVVSSEAPRWTKGE
jgi:hypothetical protein